MKLIISLENDIDTRASAPILMMKLIKGVTGTIEHNNEHRTISVSGDAKEIKKAYGIVGQFLPEKE